MSKKIKVENIYRYIFYLFLFSIPLQTRKVFLTDYSFYTGDFTEYGTIFLYLSDVLFLASLSAFVIFNRSIIKNGLDKLKKENGKIRIRIFCAMFALILWSFISTLSNGSYAQIGIYRTIKIAEMIFLAIFVYLNFKDKYFLKSSLFILAFSGIFQSIIAILQFLYQKSLFPSPLLHKLTGEALLSPTFAGIAKISIENEKLIRGYGTFPHPNLLGGFLILSIFSSLFIYLEHKSSYLSNILTYLKLNSYKNIKYISSMIWFLIFTIQFIALFLSFSRSSWLGILIAIIFFIALYVKIVSRETIKSFSFKKYSEILFSLFFLLVFCFSNINFISSRISQDISNTPENTKNIILPQNNTFNDRKFFNNVSRETFFNNPITGSGPGTAIFQIEPYLSAKNKDPEIESWQYQPTHNIYLLAASEIGTIGFLIFAFIIFHSTKYALHKIVSRETIFKEKVFKAIILSAFASILFIGYFDHYFWTLQQGQIIFWIVIGMLLA